MVAAVNYVGVKPGSRLLNAFVILKLVPLALLIGAGLLRAGGGGATPEAALGPAGPALPPDPTADAVGFSAGPLGLILAFGGALIPIMFSYGGWQNANYLAEEMKDPVRDMPVSLLAGTALVVLVYGLVNYVYLATLGHAGLGATTTPASDAAAALFGRPGEVLVTLGIAVSTFGFLDLTMLAPTRVYYAMARDGVFPERVARLHPRFDTPSVAIVVQTVWALVLVATGTYAQLVDYVVSADWLFFGLAGAAVFVFRRRIPVEERPAGVFNAPGYPIVPGLFVAVAALILVSVVWSSPVRSLLGFAILVAGVPAFLFWRGRSEGRS
jgi:APA family basic amino acid/polyamine antiporter